MNKNGFNSPNWIGGRYKTSDGYIVIYSPNHPFKDSDGYVREHKLVMEEKLGRYLKPGEIIHHIDFNKSNNNINNLILFSNISEHSKFHSLLNIDNYIENMDIPKQEEINFIQYPRKVVSGKYVNILVDGKWIIEHRYNVERKICRKLSKEEVVHHINGNKQDNRISNLFLFSSEREHQKFHSRIKQFGFTNIIMREISNRWNPYLIFPLSSPNQK